MKTNVLIHGGGIGGLTVALKLAKCGIDVCVAEQLKGPSHSYKGELLQPKSLDIFHRMGIFGRVQRISHKINHIDVIEMITEQNDVKKIGQTKMSYDVIDYPFNYAFMTPHEELKDVLLKEAQAYPSFHYLQPARFQGFHKNGARLKMANGEIDIQADFYIGAEGRKSKTREEMNVNRKEHTYDHHFLTVTFPRPPSMTEGKIISTPDTFLGLFPLPNNMVRTVYLIPSGEYKNIRQKEISFLHQKYIELCPELDGYVTQLTDWKLIQLMIPVHFHADQYVKDNIAILGDAAHSVHPMAGEGMNLAIQDGDVLGELLCWMYKHNLTDHSYLTWYEKVRKPRTKEILKISHLSALAYSKPFKSFTTVRYRVMKQMTTDSKLHTKQMLNISGLGLWKENIVDRFIQIGLFPPRKNTKLATKGNHYFFHTADDYPWKIKGVNTHD
ncbi:FAD-dependent oxidoreductase [Metabacillus iocasae]|uniref:2-polyprenyl-6-methoxyphenol hydroxylase-like FAD-dependent oxidoreductase n=1 Tax=Priestia iocasae TaxID=2291674 RepID=A0ABS2QYP9_9BACI|nr:NAD(P)/FAD-dependent oxidoreductase [Metabacillus iocasae]MBM7704623.1 2-polyprenyl-6-methoxyphenol hydroxylase-like FAD-dependent oxidoreductase [Metabacillus iocasae]